MATYKLANKLGYTKAVTKLKVNYIEKLTYTKAGTISRLSLFSTLLTKTSGSSSKLANQLPLIFSSESGQNIKTGFMYPSFTQSSSSAGSTVGQYTIGQFY